MQHRALHWWRAGLSVPQMNGTDVQKSGGENSIGYGTNHSHERTGIRPDSPCFSLPT